MEFTGTAKRGAKTSNPQTLGQRATREVSKAIAMVAKGHATFLLSDGSERTQMIKSQCISINKKTGKRERLRYIEGVSQLLMGKQVNVDGNYAAYIVLRNGKLTTDDSTKIEYLQRHPEFGGMFYQYDPVDVAEKELALDDAIETAVWYARKGLNDEEAKDLARLLKLPNIDELKISQIRIFLISAARTSPEEFNEKREGAEAKINAILAEVFDGGSVLIDKGVLKYKAGGKAILEHLPNIGIDGQIEFIIRWIMTSEDGQKFLKTIED